MHGTIGWIDLSVVGIYFAATLLIGFWSNRANRNAEAMMNAGGRLPGWVVGLSIFGTFVSTITYLAVPGKAFSGDWSPLVFAATIPFAAALSIWRFVPYYRAASQISAYERFEAIYGPWARIYSVVCYMLTQLARTASILYLLALAMHPLLGVELWVIIVITGLCVTAYTVFGGIEAVIWTDVMQSFVLIAGPVATLIILVASLPNGWSDVWTHEVQSGRLSLGSTSFRFDQQTIWVTILYGLVINLQNFGIDQSYVQRYQAASSEKEAKRSVWVGALLYLPVAILFLSVGSALHAYYQCYPGLAAEHSIAQLKADEVLPRFVASGLPTGIAGLIIAAVFAAAMSTISSSLNGCGTLYVCDFHRRYFEPSADQDRSLPPNDEGQAQQSHERSTRWALSVATAISGLLGTVSAIAMIQVKSALDAWWNLSGVFGGGMLGLFLLSRVVTHPHAKSALLATVVSVIVMIWISFLPDVPQFPKDAVLPIHKLMANVVGTALLLLVGYAGTLWMHRSLSAHA